MVLGKYCFEEEAFAAEAFDAAAFLEDCRARSPMETVHQDLKQFQTALENQLVAIINEDYAEFLQLSSKLKGVDEAVIQTQLQTADELQQQERDLQLSIEISQKLLLLEDLLEIESPVDSDGEQSVDKDAPVASDDDSDDEFENFDRVKRELNATSAAEGCAKLERAAQIFVQLDLEFTNGMHLSTIQREEKRLAVIEETLLHRLETEFATEIFPDTFYNRDHAISALTLSYLLRAYVLLHKSHIPEEMIGRLLVQPFAEENLTRGKLDGRVRGSCEGLPQIYESILEFISNKFAGTLALSVCQGESNCSVDILGNAIWKPLQEILSTKHGVIFQAADPERFHQSYTISMRFLADIEERFCKTEIMKIRFRSHESVVEFKEKWNIDVYFQLRASQLASSLERSFGVKREQPATSDSSSDNDKAALAFENSKKLWQAMQDCWSEKIFLEPLLPNFCKLCMQLFAYYIGVWKEPLLNAVAVLNGGTKVDFAAVPLYFLSTEEDLLFAGSDFHLLYTKVSKQPEHYGLCCVAHSLSFGGTKQISQDLVATVKAHVAAFTDDSNAFTTELFQEYCEGTIPDDKQTPTHDPIDLRAQHYPEFLEKWGVHFDVCKRQQLLQAIVDDVCEVYSTLSSELLRSALDLEESLKSRKLQRHSGSSSTLANNAVSDTEKMRMQLLLDLEEIQRGDASWDRVFRKKSKKEQYLAGFPGLVGNTPLVELISLSKATGCRILVGPAALHNMHNMSIVFTDLVEFTHRLKQNS
ncbi:unnamed protein product [Phytophthora lilii]|uniref:Conserved oligomeric Golgi complex subunit 2 n=1 Tax=Phytophthora lilii TaxID=2077276 RepID=A0A9W6T9X0_9STRA|nr:unnamed protein product [Phytophthora lilii]